MKKSLLFIAVITLSLTLSSCGYMGGAGPGNPQDQMPSDSGMMDGNTDMMNGNTGYSGNEEASHDDEHEEVAPPPADLTFDEEKAKNTFLQNCSRCHGANLQGGGPYPSLQQVGLTHTKDDILNVIKTGPSMMPSNLVSGEEAENLAKWLWTKR